MTVHEFNESHIGVFSRPQPVSRALQIFRGWVGTGNNVIDVGCGSGFYADICQQYSNRVFGVDITTQVQTANTLSIAVCSGNIESALPFPDESFSLASMAVSNRQKKGQVLSILTTQASGSRYSGNFIRKAKRKRWKLG